MFHVALSKNMIPETPIMIISYVQLTVAILGYTGYTTFLTNQSHCLAYISDWTHLDPNHIHFFSMKWFGLCHQNEQHHIKHH